MEENKGFIFERINYIILAVGVVVMALGFALMVGGASEDPNVFNPEVYSFRRITLAPIVIVLGLGIELLAIMYRPKK